MPLLRALTRTERAGRPASSLPTRARASLQTPGATLQVVTPEDIQYQDSVAGFLYQILAGTIFLHLDEVSAGAWQALPNRVAAVCVCVCVCMWPARRS